MAKKLTEYEFGKAKFKYPWDQWLDGKIWRLEHGTDFQGEVESMRVNIYTAAKRIGIKVRTSVEVPANADSMGADIVMQAYDDEGKG